MTSVDTSQASSCLASTMRVLSRSQASAHRHKQQAWSTQLPRPVYSEPHKNSKPPQEEGLKHTSCIHLPYPTRPRPPHSLSPSPRALSHRSPRLDAAPFDTHARTHAHFTWMTSVSSVQRPSLYPSQCPFRPFRPPFPSRTRHLYDVGVATVNAVCLFHLYDVGVVGRQGVLLRHRRV